MITCISNSISNFKFYSLYWIPESMTQLTVFSVQMPCSAVRRVAWSKGFKDKHGM